MNGFDINQIDIIKEELDRKSGNILNDPNLSEKEREKEYLEFISKIQKELSEYKMQYDIGANIREAQYAHGKADFTSKLQIALKEANETGYWLELLYKTNYIDEQTYKSLDTACTSIRVMLISSVNTVKNK